MKFLICSIGRDIFNRVKLIHMMNSLEHYILFITFRSLPGKDFPILNTMIGRKKGLIYNNLFKLSLAIVFS